MPKKFLLYLLLFILIFLFVFKDLVLNLSANLLDWRDYPYVIWVIYQSITHISNLDFINFFETNAFYPHKLTLLFSDILLPQALIMLPFFSLTKNLILSFNLLFATTFVLNFVSTYLFWKQIFKKELLSFLGSLLVIFSPFFHLELSHFQMLSYWPFFFAFYFLLKNEGKYKTKYLLLVGLFITIQFLSSVYLSVYLIFSILIFYTIQLVWQKEFKKVLSNVSIIFIIFIITSGVFIKGYIDMKNTYNIKRDLKEFITYSAHLSDYIFTSQIKSLIHQSSVMKVWNKADKNWSLHSSFPGFLIFVLSIYALFRLIQSKNSILINLELNREKAFFLTLIITGFLFSLGPRLNFNGNYAHIPLPYTAILKFIPASDVIRVPARWSFLFFLGMIYFSLVGLNKFGNKSSYKIVFPLVFVIFILEHIPFNIKSVEDSYITGDYKAIKNICSQKRMVLLEIPVTHLDAYPNIIEGLTYISKVELASTYHGCFLVNGYSGYDLPQIFQLKENLYKAILTKDIKTFLSYINAYGIDIVKFNPSFFIKELAEVGKEFIDILEQEGEVSKIDNNILLFRTRSL